MSGHIRTFPISAKLAASAVEGGFPLWAETILLGAYQGVATYSVE
jgi:hypothetical protein